MTTRRIWYALSVSSTLAALASIGCGETESHGNSTSGGGTSSGNAGSAASAGDVSAAGEGSGGTAMGGGGAGSGSGGDGGGGSSGAAPTRPFRGLAVGYSGACIIDDLQRVACWGENPGGETGLPPNVTATLQLVEGMPEATQVVMGNTHTCALATSGDVYCWGSNQEQQLGHAAGTEGDELCLYDIPCSWTPVKIEGLPAATAIATSAGYGSVCALVDGGSVYCWGETQVASAGTNDTCGLDGIGHCFNVPQEIAGVTGLTDLAVGSGHGCGNTASGLLCWGNNLFHEISIEPCPLPYGFCTDPVLRDDLGLLAAPPGLGVNTTCAIKQTGELVCFGRNDYAQLAQAPDSTSAADCFSSCSPDPVTVLDSVIAVSPTSEWSYCAIGDDQRAYCWGENESGNLGHPAAQQGDTMCGAITCNPAPSLVEGVEGVTAIAAGHWTSCAIDGAGELWCWGGLHQLAPTQIE